MNGNNTFVRILTQLELGFHEDLQLSPLRILCMMGAHVSDTEFTR